MVPKFRFFGPFEFIMARSYSDYQNRCMALKQTKFEPNYGNASCVFARRHIVPLAVATALTTP